MKTTWNFHASGKLPLLLALRALRELISSVACVACVCWRTLFMMTVSFKSNLVPELVRGEAQRVGSAWVCLAVLAVRGNCFNCRMNLGIVVSSRENAWLAGF